MFASILALFWSPPTVFLLKTAATAGKEAHESGGGKKTKKISLKEAKIHHIAEGGDNSPWVYRCT